MPQDRESGLRASRYGKKCARLIADAIGAQMIGNKSNECILNNQRVLIKTGHHKTSSVGVLYHMTDRIQAVLAAFEQADESYRVMRLPIKRCAAIMNAKPTRSLGPSAKRVGMIPRKVFEDEGQLVQIVQIEKLSEE
jgi:hypothetical protein